ncbi:putative U4/U6 small nuclear ribonucleoprotein Prp3 [Blattamonas nauphoetae]|uniref:U4/U6 small nuclear ribonucleoprotein Prp3 n=1 Tax=Blattamonas nauphoetae TaxID=2049346 RepID=A0ABQ9YFJ8_9EUKA|nr:putative U4/U6 small nuclear ribonucleoprotein Prp3 [Blattamonas nauphoetae]
MSDLPFVYPQPHTPLSKPTPFRATDEGSDEGEKRVRITSSVPLPPPTVISQTNVHQQSFVDPRLETGSRRSRKGGLNFVDDQRYTKKAERLRNKELAQRVQAFMMNQGQVSLLNKASMLDDDGTITFGDFGTMKPQVIPQGEFEWWDQPFCTPSESLPTDEVEEQPSLSSYWDRYKLTNQSQINGSFNFSSITGKIVVPPPIPAPDPKMELPPLTIELTKKERRKIRHRERMQRTRDIQDKIRCGLLPPPPPKVKLSNMARVLTNELMANPTLIEKKVREEQIKRAQQHHERNQERKLTKEERKQKILKKAHEDVKKGVYLALFFVVDLTNPKLQYRVRTNAKEYHVSGVCLMVGGGVNLIVAEGGEKALKSYTRRLLEGVNWKMDRPIPPEGSVLPDPSTLIPVDQNRCELIWRGLVKKQTYRDFRIETVNSPQAARNVLNSVNLGFLWEAFVKHSASDASFSHFEE